MTVDVVAVEGHFADHSRPVWNALPLELRGSFNGDRVSDAVLVSSHGDLREARIRGYDRIAYLEHGAGQSYRGDPASARHRSYAGGVDHDDVDLFLVPGPDPAARWREAYPAARVEQVGCPKVDTLPALEAAPGTVALSFHYHAMAGCAESNGAWRWYRSRIAELARRVPLIGHAHPRWAARIRPWFVRAGVPFVESFDDVCRQASVYVCDNSSTIFEFAAQGRPVVVLNSPEYRRSIDHGLRFWEAASVGVNVNRATDLVAGVEEALLDEPRRQVDRETAVRLVYEPRTNAAAYAATALIDWLAEPRIAAA